MKNSRNLFAHLPSLLAALLCLIAASVEAADKSKPAAAPKPAPKAPATAGRGATPAAAGRGTTAPGAGRGTPAAAGRGTPGTPGRGAAPAAGRGAAPTNAVNRGPAARPNERITHTPGGGEIHRGADGRIHDVHAHGMDIHHGPGNSRTIIRERDGRRFVSDRYGHGYVERRYGYRGAEFVHRTYYINGRAYVNVYRPYVIGGVPLAVYAPPVFYAPAFYGWVYNPWVAPVVYPWGWAGNPWYAYWGPYFTPYPAYATAALWLTDYYVATTLQAAYLQQQAALANAQPVAAPTPLTPDVKQAIADEVKRQLALENSEAAAGAQAPPDPGSSGVARMLADNTPHVFLVSAPLDVPSNAGGCGVTEGDVLQLNPGTPPNSTSANLVVMASKGMDCARGNTVTVGVADLQEMQNHMRETIDQGLGNLQKEQGQKGLPKAPASATAMPMQTAFAAAAPPPEPNVGSELSQQTKEADSAEREVLSQEAATTPATATATVPAAPAATPTAPAKPPEPLNLDGKTPDQVKAALGEPTQIINLGTKQIMVYKDIKVTFTNGKATSEQ